jgi:uncharacterized protein (TIRG00374 family)
MAKKKSHLLIGISFSLFFLLLVFSNINLTEFLAAFSQTNYPLIFLSIIFFFIGYCCRIERWRNILIIDNPNISWKECFGPFYSCVAANNVLPFRAGDLLRVLVFNRRLKISGTTSVAALIVEKILDLVIVIIFLGFALSYFDSDASNLIGIGYFLLITIAIAIILVVLFPKFLLPIFFLLTKLLSKISPIIGKQSEHKFTKIFTALNHVSQGPNMIKLIIWSLFSWFFEGLLFLCAAVALPSLSKPWAALMAFPIGTLSTTIPSTPGFVGTFDFFTTHSMITLGNTIPSASAYALLVHVILWLPPTIIGGIYIFLHPIKKQDYSKAV